MPDRMLDMSERIQTLAKEAGFVRDKYGLYWDMESNADGVDLELFAEAVIKDMLLIFANHRGGWADLVEAVNTLYGVQK